MTEICTKVRRVVGLIYRQSYQYSTPETLNQLHISCVRLGKARKGLYTLYCNEIYGEMVGELSELSVISWLRGVH